MPWVFRGLRNGILTTRWPKRADSYFDSFPAAVSVVDDPKAATSDTSHSGSRGMPDRCNFRGGLAAAGSWALHSVWALCRGGTRLVRLAIRFGDSTAEPQRRGGRRS